MREDDQLDVYSEPEPPVVKDRLLKFFLPAEMPTTPQVDLAEKLRNSNKEFERTALWIHDNIQSSPERTIVLRKLLEAKDAAIRSIIFAGE